MKTPDIEQLTLEEARYALFLLAAKYPLPVLGALGQVRKLREQRDEVKKEGR